MTDQAVHPLTPLLRMERMPHIWCPGCGLGTATRCFADAIDKAGLAQDEVCVVSGIGCSGRVAGYLNFDSFHTTHGRAIPFATGVKLARPDLKVVVFSGDGDLAAIGGNHLMHAARRNLDLTVMCVNNFNYGMTGGQAGPTTPQGAVTSTTPMGCYEPPFNLVRFVAACGAGYVSRFTTLDPRRLTESMAEALLHPGFSFVEVIAPCTELYARRNKLGDGIKMLEYYRDSATIKHGEIPDGPGIGFQAPFETGCFVRETRSHYQELRDEHFRRVLGEDYRQPGNGEG